MKSNIAKHSGVGLIEVLITTVVIALGLLAVARFQVGVIGESRDNKAMVEARNYCETGLEEFRSLMSRADFIAFAEDLNPVEEEYTGQSAVFTRTLMVENLPQPGVTTADAVREKRVTATCSWDGAQQPVVVQTILSLHGANSSALAVGLGGGGGPAISPSLNAGSSDDIGEVLPLQPSDEGYGNAGQVVDIDGVLFVVQANGKSASKSEFCDDIRPVVAPFESGLRARRVDNDGDTLLESIELFEVVPDSNGKAVCIPRVRFNGGVVIPIRGTVHSRATDKKTLIGLELFTLNVSESGAYCVFNPKDGDTSAPYTCYVGGNCAHGPTGIDDDFTQCPADAIPGVLANVGEGGWRGRVGLLNVASSGLNVCFAEEVTPEDFGGRDSARSYFSYNTGPNSSTTTDDRSQGINKPYACHDFLIVDGKPNDRQLSQACEAAASSISGLKLASKTISRTISTGSYNNVYDPVIDVESCSDITVPEYTISGTLGNQPGLPLVQAWDGGTTWDCVVISETYSCTFRTVRDAVEIWALWGDTKYPVDPDDACIVDLDPLESGCDIIFPDILDGPAYRLEGFIYGDNAAATDVSLASGLRRLEVQYGSGATPCTVGDHVDGRRAYTCEFVVPETVVTPVLLFAEATTQYSVSDGSDTVTLPVTLPTEGDFPRVISGPDITVTPVSTYQLSGTFTFSPGLSGNDSVTPAVNAPNSVDCSGQELLGMNRNRLSVDYECTVKAGQQSVSYTIEPVCIKDKGTNYALSMDANIPGAVPSLTGALTVNLDVATHRSVAVTVTRTNNVCGQ